LEISINQMRAHAKHQSEKALKGVEAKAERKRKLSTGNTQVNQGPAAPQPLGDENVNGDVDENAEGDELYGKCKVSEDVLMAIISDLVELGEFDAELWNENRIVWGAKFTDSIEDAYKKRSNKIFKREELLQLLVGLGVRKPPLRRGNSPVNPQSKEEYSKEKNTKVNDAIENQILDSALVKKAHELTVAICEYFSVKQNPLSNLYTTIDDFTTTLAHRNELEIGALALKNYMAYKARSQQEIHGVLKWIGTKENHYQGEWILTDWDKKNKNYVNGTGKGNYSTSAPAASARVQTGKGFRD
jgi:hypothetical protein